MKPINRSIFRVSSECLELGLRAGAIVFRGVQIAEASAELKAEIAEGIFRVRSTHGSMSDVRATSEIAKFREILKQTGVNPRKVSPSVEILTRSAIKRGALPAINNLVDAYNLVSVLTRCSLGAHDLDRISLPIELRFFQGDEKFMPLGSKEEQAVETGEFGYVDAERRVLCRLDVIQAEFSKITPHTQNVLLIVEGTSAHSWQTLVEAFDASSATITKHCGGSVEIVAMPEENL